MRAKGRNVASENSRLVPGTARVREGLLTPEHFQQLELPERTKEEVFQDKMRSSLLALKEQMLRELVHHSREFRDLLGNPLPSDLADIASQDTERRLLSSLSAAEARQLQLIESALARLRDGHYGICVRCGAKISQERLEAIPYALLCLECQSREEHRNR